MVVFIIFFKIYRKYLCKSFRVGVFFFDKVDRVIFNKLLQAATLQ